MQTYDVAIIGAGVTGSALLYLLSTYSDVKRIAVIEKYQSPAQVNSSSWNNSQTLHFGDIETNYSLAKASEVKQASAKVARYVERYSDQHIHRMYPKMVLGVGTAENAFLSHRYNEFHQLFSNLELIGREELKEREPAVMRGRINATALGALCSSDGYTVDFGQLCHSFIKQSLRVRDDLTMLFDTSVVRVRSGNEYTIDTSRGPLHARSIVAAAGAHSLVLAQQLGYGCDLGIMPVAGEFYAASGKILNGKVYTVQNPKLPFAAIHGDPDLNDDAITRFGPTAMVVPIFERGKYGTIVDFLNVSANMNVAKAFASVLMDNDTRGFAFENLRYKLPGGDAAFTEKARKIVPELEVLQLLHNVGGIRPQLCRDGKIFMGEAKVLGDNAIFDITPSPGASVCIRNGFDDAMQTCRSLGAKFDVARFENDFRQ